MTQLLGSASIAAASLHKDSVWELVCHPGYHDRVLDAQHTRLKNARETERAALAAIMPNLEGFQLVSFDSLG